jgi:hypothetical protein
LGLRGVLISSAVIVAVIVSLAIVTAVLGVTVRFGAVDASYYPRVLAIVQNASPAERESMLKLWASQTPGGYYGFVTTFELHHVLWYSDYCTNLISWPGCKPLPTGSEAQGVAKEMLDQLSIPYRK